MYTHICVIIVASQKGAGGRMKYLPNQEKDDSQWYARLHTVIVCRDVGQFGKPESHSQNGFIGLKHCYVSTDSDTGDQQPLKKKKERKEQLKKTLDTVFVCGKNTQFLNYHTKWP